MHKPEFFGVATVGEKGQVVIPAEAREALHLEKGDKLVVLSGPNNHVLLLAKPSQIEEFARKLNEQAMRMQDFIVSTNSDTLNK